MIQELYTFIPVLSGPQSSCMDVGMGLTWAVHADQLAFGLLHRHPQKNRQEADAGPIAAV